MCPSLTSLIRDRGPMTVAAFMELALYDPLHGYYATSRQRSGAAGDFFTSVDVGPLFGEMLAVQIADICARLRRADSGQVDLVEIGAGNGRLTRDILDTAAREFPSCYDRLQVVLVEQSPVARRAAAETLADHLDKMVGIRSDLPETITGIIIANELLDAFPVHLLTMTTEGLREVYVTATPDDGLCERIGPLSDTRLQSAAHRDIPVGWRGEVSLAIPHWLHRVSSALQRGFLICFDYIAGGGSGDSTLASCSRHRNGNGRWIDAPGHQDITSHVDLGRLSQAASDAGLDLVGAIDQTYFLLSLGLLDRLPSGDSIDAVRRRLAARTLTAPGGLGSTMKAIGFRKGAPHIELRGFAGGRLT
jgi:SAM-dependent MidA family methyltransferase